MVTELTQGMQFIKFAKRDETVDSKQHCMCCQDCCRHCHYNDKSGSFIVIHCHHRDLQKEHEGCAEDGVKE